MLCVDDDIIQICCDEITYILEEDIHYSLDSCWCLLQIKRHNHEMEKIMGCCEGHFGLILFRGRDLLAHNHVIS